MAPAICCIRHSYTQSAMPIYEYRCERGHTFEVMQRMTDDPLTSCSTCEAPVQRVFHPVAVHFKGSGFYNTDYGKKKSGASSTTGEGGSASKESDSSSKTETSSKKESGSSSSGSD
jgi:putative FmdB family regulatory protein